MTSVAPTSGVEGGAPSVEWDPAADARVATHSRILGATLALAAEGMFFLTLIAAGMVLRSAQPGEFAGISHRISRSNAVAVEVLLMAASAAAAAAGHAARRKQVAVAAMLAVGGLAIATAWGLMLWQIGHVAGRDNAAWIYRITAAAMAVHVGVTLMVILWAIVRRPPRSPTAIALCCYFATIMWGVLALTTYFRG